MQKRQAEYAKKYRRKYEDKKVEFDG